MKFKRCEERGIEMYNTAGRLPEYRSDNSQCYKFQLN